MRRLLLSFLVIVAACRLAPAAPAPPPRKPKPPPPSPAFVGVWKMTWKVGTYRATFSPDGSYSDGRDYAGTWCLDKTNNILHVEELSRHGSVIRWSVTLTGPRCGILDDGSPWQLD